MKSAWTKHLTNQDEKERMQASIIAARPVIGRVIEIMEEDEKALSNAEISIKSYDLPNWDYRQAHANGYKACIKHYKELLNLDQGTTTK